MADPAATPGPGAVGWRAESAAEVTPSTTAPEPGEIVWSFRLERQDEAGNRVPPVPVEMRARSFEGFISGGDLVEVDHRWSPGRTLPPRRVHNVTTGAVVKAPWSRPCCGCSWWRRSLVIGY